MNQWASIFFVFLAWAVVCYAAYMLWRTFKGDR